MSSAYPRFASLRVRWLLLVYVIAAIALFPSFDSVLAWLAERGVAAVWLDVWTTAAFWWVHGMLLAWVWFALRRSRVGWMQLCGPLNQVRQHGKFALLGLLTLAATVPCISLTYAALAEFWPYQVEGWLNRPLLPISARTPVGEGLIFLVAVVSAPVCEELFFRGYLLRRWAARWGVRTGVVMSSLVFGLLHGHAFLASTVAGLLFAVLALHTRSLWLPMLAHALHNGTVLVWEWASPPQEPGSNWITLEQFQQGWTAVAASAAIVVPLIGIYCWRHWPGRQGWTLWNVDHPEVLPATWSARTALA